MLLFFRQDTGLALIIMSMILIGVGMGMDSTAFILSVQNAVPWRLRGVATASTQFARTIGGTIGVAFMGTVLNIQLAEHFAPVFARFADATRSLPHNVAPANVLLTPNIRTLVPASFLQQLQQALSGGLFWVYLVVFALMLVSLFAMFWLPGGRADQHRYREEKDESGAEMETEISLIG
jgi:hypothetical protein